MRLVGLNTALRCGRLGDEGRALSVIAQELRGYANQTVEDANALVSVLQETVASAERFERERRGQGAERIALLERDMADALSTFQASGGRLNDALAILSREGEQVGQVLADTAASIRVHGDVGPALHTAGDRLGDIAGTMASPVQDAGLVTERLRWFGADRYTMASEREIHERIAAALVGARGGCDTSETRLVSLSRSDEALLEDVLF
jgi:hypothetical protein